MANSTGSGSTQVQADQIFPSNTFHGLARALRVTRQRQIICTAYSGLRLGRCHSDLCQVFGAWLGQVTLVRGIKQSKSVPQALHHRRTRWLSCRRRRWAGLAVFWPCISHTHMHTHTHKAQACTCMCTHTHSLTLPPPSLSLSLSHTHTHTHAYTEF